MEEQLQFGWQAFEAQSHQMADAQQTIEIQKRQIIKMEMELQNFKEQQQQNGTLNKVFFSLLQFL